MRENSESSVACHHRVGFLGLLVTLGIVFGDIGTSPLYVMKAILHTGETINENTILGALSCIIWTLTLQTTIKYVCVALRADNNGIPGDFRFIIIHRVYYPESSDNRQQNLLMGLYALIGKIGIDEPKALGLDTSMVVVERVPLIISQHNRSIRRIAQMEEEK